MDSFDYNSKYLTKNGRPWFPIMGELHYSRFDCRFWREEIMKMKAGGVSVISSYVIWIHHEETENEYDFTGRRNLRKFVELCGECGVYLFLRIGPWAHGEVRNGGFPDWLLKKDFPLRENNEPYFAEVKKLYGRIYREVKGCLLKDGGPIIGVQIENEYGHCGGLTGEAGELHMKTLLKMAKEIGFDVPLYTATGWGGAMTGGMLAVMGGYCEAPWDQRSTEIEPSGNYIITHERNDHNIGSDYGIGEGITFDADKVPYLTAELGGGLQVTRHRRPVARARDIGAVSLVKLASGVNLLGYYMYHGGTNPVGKYSYLQESRATGYLNDLPELTYDFNAPIKEYGQISDTYKELRLLAMFVADFGEGLCRMKAYIPADNPLDPADLTSLRHSVRHDGESGYLFVNNYQRRRKMAEHKNVSLSAEIGEETYVLPQTDIHDGDYFFFPLNMKIGAARIKTALASPLCVVGNTFVFYGEGKYDTEGDLNGTEILTLTREQALNACKLRLEREYLVITDNYLVENGGGYDLYAESPSEVLIYPDRPTFGMLTRVGTRGKFGVFAVPEAPEAAKPSAELVSEENGLKKYRVTMDFPPHVHDCYLDIAYSGESAKAYLDGEMIADNFFTGQKWTIGLRGFEFPRELIIEIAPLSENSGIFLETLPPFIGGNACSLDSASLRAVRVTPIEA